MIPTKKHGTKRMPRVLRSVSAVSSVLLLFSLHTSFFLPTAEASKRKADVKLPLPIVPDDSDDHHHHHHKSVHSILQEIDSFVTDATSYLIRISHTAEQDPTFPGRFTYQADTRKDLNPTLEMHHWKHHPQDDYNLLRHNGAIYALSQAYIRNEEHHKDSKVPHHVDKFAYQARQDAIRAAIEGGVGYLRDNALLPVPGHPEWLAAWERGDINDPHSEPEAAKLGGAGLAMIALGKMETIHPNSVPMDQELRKLGAFVESLQDKEDGSFTCKYYWQTGPNDSWVSLYYPGEAALGLVTLAELELRIEEHNQQQMAAHPELEMDLQHYGHHGGNPFSEKKSQRWIRVAANALLYLEGLRRYQELSEVEPDHWALLATGRLLPILDRQRRLLAEGTTKRKQADLEYTLIYNHGVKVASSMVHSHTTAGLLKHQGCFTYDARTCPTATRLEGLLSAMTFIRDTEVYFGGLNDATELLRNRIERDVASGIRFLLDAQQKDDHNNMRGAVPGKYTGDKPADIKEDESEDESEDDGDFPLAEVRVDYVQHSMSAMIAYEAFLLDKQEQDSHQKPLHQQVNDKVHKAVHHVRRKIAAASGNETFVNHAILAGVCLAVIIVIALAYLPWSKIPFLRRRRRRRRVKRQD